jgi:decaprenylphospho-beta-D-erythro-pentofuranosid-2-ulose 2-reductase
MANWLIIGATSGIAKHLVREFASKNHRLFLADRKDAQDECERVASDLKVRYNIETQYGIFEALEFENHNRFVESVEFGFGKLDGIVWLSGIMFKQNDLQANVELVRKQHDVNYTAAASLLTIIANRMEQRGSGTIVAFSSPAGDRIRKSNYYYGCDKMALSGLLDGLRVRLHDKGVKIITIKPGPTATPMTADITGGKPLANPEEVAKCIANGIFKNQTIVYAPPIWKYIMFIFRIVPRFILQKVNV